MGKRHGWTRIVVVATVFVLVASACAGGDGGATPAPGTTRSGISTGVVTGTRTDGSTGALSVSLSPGEAYGNVPAVVSVVDGSPLDAQAIADVVDRLPDWRPGGGDRTEFNRPVESLPRPRVGDTLEVAFPPPVGAPVPKVDSGPLEVLRYQPDGDVGLAPFLSITFNQPMVALGTVDQVDSSDVPVTLTPDVPGRWQWIGTRTLRFEHDPQVFDRLAMATHYTVEIPAGTTSVAGGVLADTVRWEFTTPAPTVQWLSPQDTTVDLEPVFLATFDQRVDPEAVLGVIRITTGGDQRKIRLATADEIAADDIVSPRVGRATEGTWVAFRAVKPFAPDQAIHVEVGPGVPSAEGPDTTDDVARFDDRTYAPLRVERNSCPSAEPCSPGWGMSVGFNNVLDPTSLDLTKLTIEPAIPGASVSAQWSQISVQGETAGDTTYRVTIPGSLKDVYGQSLGEDTTVELRIGPATPLIDQLQQQLVTLDPLADGQTFPVVVRNHDKLRVRVYDVSPDDWADFERHLAGRRDTDGPVPLPDFPVLSDEVISTGAVDNVRHEVRIDLEPVLKGKHGQVVVRIDGTGRYADIGPRDEDFWSNAPIEVWVQDTDIGLDMVYDATSGVAWTTDLRTGAPLPGVQVEAFDRSGPVTTDSDGLATITLGSRPLRPLVARLGDDVAINPTRIQRSDLGDQTIWYVVDDRGMYRPGETVRVKGWIRNLAFSGGGGLELPGPGETITWTARDSFGNELGSGRIRPDKFGGFDLAIDLPMGTNLGSATIQFVRPSDRDYGFFNHPFQIQEFRRPEFEVTTRTESPGPYFVDEPATVAVDATYFSGGPLPDAPVEWRVTTQQASYSPPNWGQFTFGVWTPWWILDSYGGYDNNGGSSGRGVAGVSVDYGSPGYPPGAEPTVETFSGRTDASGTDYLRMDFAGDGNGLPTTVTAEASVTDVNRQVWTDRTDVLVHPASLYVGLRSTRTFVKAGEPLDVKAIVTDIDGNAVAGRGFKVTAERLVSQYVDGEWTEVAVDTETCDTASADDPVTCTFAMANGGRYRISADVVDDAGRSSHSEMTRWVTGGDAVPSRSLDLQTATLVPDKPTYAAGDTARILVESPFGPATGLVTWGAGAIGRTEVFRVDDAGTIVEIPIADSDVPGVQVQVELVGTVVRTADDGTTLSDVPPRPAYATGSLELRVPPASRTLTVTATPADGTLAPGSSTSVGVAVTDVSGAPVEGAEMLVVVVDEAILALSGYELLDPLDLFYRPAPTDIGAVRGRDSILLENPQELVDRIQKQAGAPATTAAASADASTEESVAPAAPGRLAYSDSVSGAPVDVRQNFDALAVFAPDVVTGADGTAEVTFDLPDNLTRYRVMVVAVDGVDRFGSGESTITAQLPLQVRPSAPRFLNFGDKFELPIVVQNLTDADTEVDVVVQTSNLEIIGSSGRRVTVPANDRVEVRFPARTDSAGTARFRAAAVGGGNADAATVSLPVYTPATAEAFATYGVIDGGAIVQPLLAPEGVFPQFGGLEIDTSSTALQALTDAVLYLSEYEYRSADAYASRILAITALRDVLDAFRADGMPTPAEMDATVRSDIAALSALQNFDGGFGSWRRDQQSSPFRSVQAMHALVEAKANGFGVRPEVMEMGRDYLRNIESHIPPNWSRATKDMLIAYALHVRSLDGDVDSARARLLWNRSGSDLGLDALAWIWPVVSDAGIEADIARTFANRVSETPQAATFATSYGEDDYLVLNSDRRTDGIVLDALIKMDPGSDLIPKVVAGLIANQVKGRWNNVQENAFILLALNDYFDTFETVDPDFVARVWLGDRYVAEHRFSGRSTDQAETLVPMSELVAQGDGELVVAKDGPGRLYYRLGLRYAPDDLTLEALDKGFVVQRSYEGVDDPADVWLDSEGVWHVRSGAEVRVRITMVNDSRRTNMALIDPLPAGLEPLNPSLTVTGEIPPGDFGPPADQPIRWWGPWFDHQNLRDDRAEAYSSYLRAGTHEYTYVARATTPGTFVVPPSRAEEIYAPEVFGRSAGATMVIEDPALLG